MGACVNGAKTACGGGGTVTNMGSGFFAAPHIFGYVTLDILTKNYYNICDYKCENGVLMKKVFAFMSKNKWITAFFFVSVLIIVSYILTMDLPEVFNGAEKWYNLFFQLSVGYIINFMFYITQVYIPNSKRSATIQASIYKRISALISHMDASLSHLATIYVDGHKGQTYTDEELKQIMLKLRFSDKVNVLNASRTTTNNNVYFTVREWLIKCISDTEKDIDGLFKYYAADISISLMEVLEAIPRSTYHCVMPTLLASPNDVNFSEAASSKDGNFFFEYYGFMEKLKHIQKNDYS